MYQCGFFFDLTARFLAGGRAEPLAQTWIRRECLDSSGDDDLTSPKRIQSCRAKAGLDLGTLNL